MMLNNLNAISQFNTANPDNTTYLAPKADSEISANSVTEYYFVQNSDLIYVGTKIDHTTGERQNLAPLRLCKTLAVIGQGIDDYGDHSRVLQWSDSLTKQEHTLALAAADIGERDGWKLLNSKGLAVASGRAAREKLADYLQSQGGQTRYLIANQSGWKCGAFVLPTGEVIGTPESRILYPASATYLPAFAQRGTSAEWRNTVGALAKDNPLAMTAVACSLAGALLELIEARDGIGLHLHTETSSGKSTCADVAASIWGSPVKLMQSWDGTGVGLTNSAEFSNSMMLYLDEIGAGDSKKMGSIIYTMLNGVSRTQGHKDGGNRAKRSWLMSLISTGEIPMSQFLNEGGHTVRGGQEIRMLDIPADVGRYRAFDSIHGCKNGGDFAIKLTAAARSHYGSIGREFVEWLMANKDSVKDQVSAAENRMLLELPAYAAPTVQRATRKFAILAAALEMAAKAQLTGWTVEESYQAVATTWQRWLSVFGMSSRDDERLIEQANGILASHQFSRFVVLPMTDKEPVTQNLMGYKRIQDGRDVFLVQPHAFKNEIIKGYEMKKACDVLHKAGMLEKPQGRDGWSTAIGSRLGQGYKMRLRLCDEPEATNHT
ncbi:DUF927 domain-containing protein [Iodobacter sp. HSC-16F04]|uniref:DUF927 domain-containing protein n=1 Tax=Iodobacter violaceini TaxID=3044271 RepID=A0ABX0KXB6_9NEIS|nr:DUF927 domain-containing protein [Iodobacter violacea]NHQ88446.1 DUF927 domain-containing protein [Iodobacter violacea]